MVQHRPKAWLGVIILCFIILVIVIDIYKLRPGMILAYSAIIHIYFRRVEAIFKIKVQTL